VKPEKQIKHRAAKLNFAQSTDNSSHYRTTGISSVNRVNAATGIKCDERHNGFATVKRLPEKSGRTHIPKRILMTSDKRRELKIKISA
jgi:hypothetical protein